MIGPNPEAQRGSSRSIAYEAARLRLAHLKIEGGKTRANAASCAVQISARALAVERVGVWLLVDGGSALECVDQFTLSTGEHTSGARIEAARYPAYFAAMEQRRAIVAHDARVDPITRELTESYLDPLGITSILDAPIIREGRVVGVVCHEHTGPQRVWTQTDMAFSSSVADMMTIIFEQVDRLDCEAEARLASELRSDHLKMEALGRLAGSVAHDFNNVLTVIGLLARDLAANADPVVAKRAADIVENVAVSARLARQLLIFGREGPSQITRVRLDELVARIEPILLAAAGSGVRFTVSVTARDPEISADPSLIEQILLNLCLNARDAVAGEGRIEVRVREPGPGDEVDADHVILEVADDGAGMDDATQSRIFEPYFTTKPQGTGLGLATVYGIIRRLGGLVHVASQIGKGTTFTVALPRAEALNG
jgi:signal transduction histidine kinase